MPIALLSEIILGTPGSEDGECCVIVTVNSVLVPVSCLLPRPRPAPRHSAAGESGGKSLRRKSVFVLQQCTADSSQSRYTAPPLRGDMKTISVKCWPW